MPLYLYLLILAVLQGATEFLPISSSAHLVVLPMFLDWPDQGILIDVSVHVGTLAAVVLYFRRDVLRIAGGGLSTVGLARKDPAAAKLFWALAIATVPVVVLGALFTLAGFEEAFRRADVIAAASIAFGLLLFWADRKGAEVKTVEGLTLKTAFLIGAAQMAALIPGVSRAGITMTAARALGFKRTEAARFSMLLSIPTILAAGGWSTFQLIRHGADGAALEAVFAGAVAFAVALGAIHFLLRWLAHADMTIFVAYRVLFGLAVLIWLA
jgi:undecaprenyl-diphosphatase